ncbi:conserved hypothetical protein [Ricinus communis]|uniref:Uncharacterized protein n=1 Tax=Ricinus communis TaxID=3988 RepID=B9TKC3_RICCO|nr:conserved hypothetical protein [Ricinus communis]
MAAKHVRLEREERNIYDLYQIDPAFYKKIISRSSSIHFSRQNSFHRCPGKVPFSWEIQPGTPRDVSSEVEILLPSMFPPGIHSLDMSGPCNPETGRMAYFFKHVKKVKNIKKIQIGLPLAVRELSIMPKPKASLKVAKACLLSNIKKVTATKNIFLGKKMKSEYSGTNGMDHNHDEFRFSELDFGDFTESPRYGSSNSSVSPLSAPSSPRLCAIKSPRILRLQSLHKGLVRWNCTNHSKET